MGGIEDASGCVGKAGQSRDEGGQGMIGNALTERSKGSDEVRIDSDCVGMCGLPRYTGDDGR